MTHQARRLLGSMLVAGAIGLAVAWAGPGAAAPDPSAQEIRDRLLGHDHAPATGAAPSAPAGAQPDCSTQEALETNPACFNQVSGSNRSFSLVKPSSSGNPGTPTRTAGRPAVGSAGRPTARASLGAPPRRTGSSGAATSCGLRDTGTDRGVNLCVTFALNSADLTPQSRSRLDRLYEAVSTPEIRGRTVKIEGYADISGNAQANQRLSEARAQSVADYLVRRGVARDHVESQGYGATHPLPDHDPKDPANRRVEARLKE